MKHLSEDDLVLHYYGELPAVGERDATVHLGECADCRRELTRLQRVLGVLDEAAIAPALPEGFERTVWARLEPNLPVRRPLTRWLGVWSPAPLALAAALLLIVGAAFFAGRLSSPRTETPVAGTPAPGGEQVRERIFLIDLGEHLDRSQRVLVELASGAGPLDVTGDRERAEQLLAANRLYRQSAAFSGDAAFGDLLDELERFLVELASGPEHLSAQNLDLLRKQIEARGLLFRVRVISSEVKEREKEANQRRTGQRS
jgi:hypothetical protein